MVRAYVLIQTRVGMGPEVARDVALIEGVISSEFVTGPYDVITSAEAATLDELGRLVATDIHGVDGVTRTITCLRAESV
ncbi:MAG TPA: Lrp/AsnC ligand binding domain-containing protein [Actinomycetota bacterium]